MALPNAFLGLGGEAAVPKSTPVPVSCGIEVA